MKVLIKASIVVMLAIGLIAALSLAPLTTAQQASKPTFGSVLNSINMSSLGPDEQKMVKSIPLNTVQDDKNLTIAKNNLAKVQAQAQIDVEKSVSSDALKLFNNKSANIPTIFGPTTTGTTANSVSPAYSHVLKITTANAGNTGYSGSNAYLVDYDVQSVQSSKTSRSYVLQFPGIGSFDAWSYVGSGFTISGSGLIPANIIAKGQWSAHTASYGAVAAASTNLNLYVYDFNTGTTYGPANIYSYTANGLYSSDTKNNQPYNTGLSINLVPAHTYMAYVKTDSSTSITGAGGSVSDVGNWDGNNYYLAYSEIDIQY